MSPVSTRPWVPGMCWLYCRRTGVPVVWLGAVSSSGIQAPMYGCEQCVAELDHMVWQYAAALDTQ
ncbi:hypothetical protein C6N75_21595 [Streptomyces solincola]|uniref:Uncharacterized protein n=1 Tax=Streptomyces solincola TaxID=2100817 RepID=A0A2S9PS38_9ACTN|nr:hypothetical protein [Streptomyces solincola]PRH77193.1 hypothetical protein C6N75_21595 [Streptomyces solincola]